MKHLYEPKCRTSSGEIIKKPIFAKDKKDVYKQIEKYSKKTGEKLTIISISNPIFKDI